MKSIASTTEFLRSQRPSMAVLSHPLASRRCANVWKNQPAAARVVPQLASQPWRCAASRPKQYLSRIPCPIACLSSLRLRRSGLTLQDFVRVRQLRSTRHQCGRQRWAEAVHISGGTISSVSTSVKRIVAICSSTSFWTPSSPSVTEAAVSGWHCRAKRK
jgi:hypothetical protein